MIRQKILSLPDKTYVKNARVPSNPIHSNNYTVIKATVYWEKYLHGRVHVNSYLICFFVYLDEGLFAEFRTIYYQTFAVIILNYVSARIIFTPRSIYKGSLEGEILFLQL